MEVPVKLVVALVLCLCFCLFPPHGSSVCKQVEVSTLILSMLMATDPLDDPTPPQFQYSPLCCKPLQLCYNNPLPEHKLHPEQGGVHISSNYLDHISEGQMYMALPVSHILLV